MTFRVKLTLMMVGLLVISQAAIITALLGTSNIDTLQRGHERLDVGGGVITQILQDRGKRLSSNAEVLASDYGFKTAVATQDTDTIESVLANHGARIAADLVMLTDTGGNLIASSHYDIAAHPRFPFPDLWAKTRAQRSLSAIIMLQGKPYQFVMVPVSAPNLIAWVGMGFLLDDALANELGAMTHLTISFVGQQPSYPPYVASTHPSERQELSTLAEQSHPATHPFFSSDKRFLTHQVTLNQSTDGHVGAVLQLPRTALMAPYERLKMQLTVIFLVTLIGALLMAFFMARTISRPIKRLTDTARRIGQGERIHDTGISDQGEIGLLASTLITMQDNLALREKELLVQSRHDLLTGLPNRLSAEFKVAELIERKIPFALKRLCINDFKQINDTFGYAIGDQVLIELGQRLRQRVGVSNYVFRIGGDEYLILYPSPDTTPQERQNTLAQLSAVPLQLEASPVTLSISVGGAHYPEHGNDAQLLLRRSDIALDIARHSTQRFQIYTPGLDEHHQRQLTIAHDLNQALQHDRLHMVYQPKINIVDDQPYQFEALVRWEHETLGFIPPDEFVALAERSGSIGLLTDWVIEHVSRQLHEWNRQGERIHVVINLSAHDLNNATLPRRLLQRIEHYALDPRQLALEVTESALMKDPVQARQLLNRLREYGFSIAIDDFGTGYSSLSQLRRLPIDELKIDKSFILKLDHQPEDVMIVRSIIDLGHNLGLKVTAEGVENAASLRLLQSMNCDTAQGYFFARPLRAEQIRDWLADYRASMAMPLNEDAP